MKKVTAMEQYAYEEQRRLHGAHSPKANKTGPAKRRARRERRRVENHKLHNRIPKILWRIKNPVNQQDEGDEPESHQEGKVLVFHCHRK